MKNISHLKRISQLTLIVLALGCNPLYAQESSSSSDPSGQNKVLQITRADTPPMMDGEMDDIWNSAEPFEDFHQLKPIEYAEPSERTVVRLLYDDNNLYISAEVHYADPGSIVANKLIQGSNLRSDDKIRVHINPFNDGRNGYLFQVNPNNVRIEALFENVRDRNFDWTAIYDTGTKLTDYGWFTEMTIPFKSISFDPNIDTWGISFLRGMISKNEEMAWSSQNGTINPSNFGSVKGFSGIQQGMGLDIIPSLSITTSENDILGTTDTDMEPSLDVFYKFTPNLTGALTFNSDFSATDVDSRQVQLSRFSLFFPEQRKFFLQEADIFEFGGLQNNGKPFFSRRIGIARGGQQLDLEAGGKLTGRIGNWNIGALAVSQAGNEGDVPVGGQLINDSELFVGRASLNVLEQSTIGAIVTSGNPTGDADNSVIGLDFNYLNTKSFENITLIGKAWYQQSDTDGLDGEDNAWGMQLLSPNREGLKGKIEYAQYGENYFPALGFANRTGIKETEAVLGYTNWLDRDSPLRFLEHIARITRVTDTDGNLESEEHKIIFLKTENQFGDTGDVNVSSLREVLTTPFNIANGVTIPVGDYKFDRYGFEIETGQQRNIIATLEFEGGGFYSGDRDLYKVKLDWQPSKYFLGSLEFEYNDIDLKEGRFHTQLLRLETDVAFNSEWAWLTTAQYDNQSNVLGINSRLQYIPTAGQEFYLIYNGGWIDTTLDRDFEKIGQSATAKVSYTFRY